MRFDFLSSLRSLSRDAKLYLLSNVMQATSVGALAILYTLFLTALGYDAQLIGALAVIGTLGGALGLIPSGALLDRVGWRTTLIFSNALGGAAILTQLLIPQRPVSLRDHIPCRHLRRDDHRRQCAAARRSQHTR